MKLPQHLAAIVAGEEPQKEEVLLKLGGMRITKEVRRGCGQQVLREDRPEVGPEIVAQASEMDEHRCRLSAFPASGQVWGPRPPDIGPLVGSSRPRHRCSSTSEAVLPPDFGPLRRDFQISSS